MSSHAPHDEDPAAEEPAMLDADEAAEEFLSDGDAAMDSDGDEDAPMEEYNLQNDSVAHFDRFQDSIFCIAQHPTRQELIAVGGSEGEELGGIGYLFDSTPDGPLLPQSYQANPAERVERKGQESLGTLDGHTDSITALAFTLPAGEALLSGGLDGQLRAWVPSTPSSPVGPWKLLASVREVDEINWLVPCPSPEYPNTFALGASDGSVWIYTIDATAPADDVLQIVQSYFIHTSSCTAGAWSPDGNLLATVSDEGSMYVWDPFGAAAAAGVTAAGSSSQAIIGLTVADLRFAVEGGLFSVAIAPSGAFLVAGGAGGAIKVVGLPQLGTTAGAGAKGGKSKKSAASQSGVILADLNTQSDSIESLAFAPAPSTLIAAGSVDGSIVLFDSAYRFSIKRHIKEAHEEESVVKVEFAGADGRVLVSSGMDGVVRKWDTVGGTGVAASGFMGEWRGHSGGVLGFVIGRDRVVTAGDDGVSLVFEAGK